MKAGKVRNDVPEVAIPYKKPLAEKSSPQMVAFLKSVGLKWAEIRKAYRPFGCSNLTCAKSKRGERDPTVSTHLATTDSSGIPIHSIDQLILNNSLFTYTKFRFQNRPGTYIPLHNSSKGINCHKFSYYPWHVLYFFVSQA